MIAFERGPSTYSFSFTEVIAFKKERKKNKTNERLKIRAEMKIDGVKRKKGRMEGGKYV